MQVAHKYNMTAITAMVEDFLMRSADVLRTRLLISTDASYDCQSSQCAWEWLNLCSKHGLRKAYAKCAQKLVSDMSNCSLSPKVVNRRLDELAKEASGAGSWEVVELLRVVMEQLR